MGQFDYTYDDIYGIKLGEYLARQGMTLQDLKDKTEMDIAILKENQIKVYKKKIPYPDSWIENVIHESIRKKQAHLEHLLDWEAEGKERF